MNHLYFINWSTRYWLIALYCIDLLLFNFMSCKTFVSCSDNIFETSFRITAMFVISGVSHSQVIITVYALSTRRRLYTSSEPSNWTPAALAPGLSWATSTWRWRTLRLPSRPTGQLKAALRIHSSLYCCGSFPCFYLLSVHQACHWSEQAWLPCLVWPGSNIWDPQDALLLFVLLSKGSPAQVWRKKKVFYSRTINII